MALTALLSNHYKYQLGNKEIDLEVDAVKVLLMRQGFLFDRAKHKTLLNLKGTISRSDISFVTSSHIIATVAGDFVAAGFVVGNRFTVVGSVSNDGVYTITFVDTLNIVVSEALVNESAGATLVMTADDELASGGGYVQSTKVLVNVVLTENDVDNRAEATWNDTQWDASGGDIGPTPGAMLVDTSTSDDTIIGYVGFGGDQTALNGTPFIIAVGKLFHI